MQKKIANNFFFLLLFLITVAFFGLLGSFLLGVFWAAVFAIVFDPLYQKVLSRFPKKSALASGITLVSILLIVIIPLSLISLALVVEALEISEKTQSGEWKPQEQIGDMIGQVKDLIPPQLEKYGLNINNIQTKVTEWAANSSQIIAKKVLGFGQGVLGMLMQFTITLYVLFFFLRDGKKLVEQMIYVLPIGDKKERQLIRRFQSVARATVKGSILIALVQGVLGGILFALLGVEGAVIWGALMIIASLLPVGALLVWGPIAAVLFLQGSYTEAIILVVVGALFIGLIDNLLRPRLVGNDTKMPDWLILLSTLGGLSWFGLSGFVLGPIIAAMFITCWQMMGDEFGEERSRPILENEGED